MSLELGPGAENTLAGHELQKAFNPIVDLPAMEARRRAFDALPRGYLKLVNERFASEPAPEPERIHTSPEEQLVRARQLKGVLERSLDKSEAAVDAKLAVLEASGNEELLHRAAFSRADLDEAKRSTGLDNPKYSFDLDEHWAYEIVSTLIGGGVVDVSYNTSRFSMGGDALLRTRHDRIGSTTWLEQTIIMAELFADLQSTFKNMTTTFVLPSYTSLSALHTAFTVLRDRGFAMPQFSIDGSDDKNVRVRTLIRDLKRSSEGRVLHENDVVFFIPNDKLAEWYKRRMPEAKIGNVILNHSVRLGMEGSYELSDAAQVSLRAETLGSALHVRFRDHPLEKSDASMLVLRALDILRFGEYQQVFINTHIDTTSYRFAKFLLTQVDRFIQARETQASPLQMEQKSYFGGNYDFDIPIEQDQQLISMELSMRDWLCEWLDIELSDAETLLDDGELVHMCVGSDLGTVMNSIKLSKGVVKGYDLSPDAQEFLRQVKEEGLKAERLQGFEDYRVQVARDISNNPKDGFYAGVLEEIKKRFVIEQHDARVPLGEDGHVRLYRLSFSLEALTDLRLEVADLMKIVKVDMSKNRLHRVKGELRPRRSVLVMNMTMGYTPQGWSDHAGNDFPGAHFEADLAVAALMEAGFRVVVCSLAEADERLRKDEEMYYIVAVPEEDADYLERMKTELPGRVLPRSDPWAGADTF